MPPAERHNSTGEIAWRIQRNTTGSRSGIGQGGGGGLFFLSSSSVGQRKAGHRDETIWVGVRPRREEGAPAMRLEVLRSCVRSPGLGRRAARRWGAE